MATQLRMKLLIDSKSKKVLFAEAGKDVIDFLFSLLAMPVGSIIKLLTEQRMVGCIANLYKSVKTLDETFILSDRSRSLLLNPTTISPARNNLFLTEARSTTTSKKYYTCPNHLTFTGMSSVACSKNVYTDVYGKRCSPGCGGQMTVEMHYVGPNSESEAAAAATGESAGFVIGVVTYTVMDDLTVMPMSTISSITLLNKFNVTDIGSLEECNVNLGMEEGLALLKASLQSNTVLTDVFLKKKMATVG